MSRSLPRRRLTVIAGAIAVMGVVISAIGLWLGVPGSRPAIDASAAPTSSYLPPRVDTPEANSMRMLNAAEVAYLKGTEGDPRAGSRTLAKFLDRRAYNGAPPVIPHKVTLVGNEKPGEPCLGCHRNGGYSTRDSAFTPTTPHPELVNCVQCHAVPDTAGTFKAVAWSKSPVDRGVRWLEGSPPVTPHGLLMRENCLGCHAGPAAVKELRTPHPERGSCLQCHVLRATTETWRRPAANEAARSETVR